MGRVRLSPASRVPVADPGWDSDAVIVDGRYIERVPRREQVRQGLERECRLLAVIAPLLPPADSKASAAGWPPDPDRAALPEGQPVLFDDRHGRFEVALAAVRSDDRAEVDVVRGGVDDAERLLQPAR